MYKSIQKKAIHFTTKEMKIFIQSLNDIYQNINLHKHMLIIMAGSLNR